LTTQFAPQSDEEGSILTSGVTDKGSLITIVRNPRFPSPLICDKGQNHT
jgi:hypothetical protein